MFSLTRIAAAAIVAAALAGPQPAQAGFVTGWDLLQVCKTNPQQAGAGLYTAQCRGYVIGVAETFDCSEPLHDFHWNNSDKVSPEDMVKTVTTWFNAHPQTLHHGANGLVAAALSESYPCK